MRWTLRAETTAPLPTARRSPLARAVTRSGSAWIFYVNGSSIGTDISTAAVPTTSAPLTIGNAEGTFHFNGLEDEISIYNRALSAAEIQSIATEGAAGKCKPTLLVS